MLIALRGLLSADAIEGEERGGAGGRVRLVAAAAAAPLFAARASRC